MRRLSFVLLWLFLVQLVYAFCPEEVQESKPSRAIEQSAEEQLEVALQELLDGFEIPALWAGKFYSDGRQVLASVGSRAWGTENPVQPLDQVHIGSCTKAMTAVLVAQCCTSSELTFKSQLQDIFPDESELRDSAWGTVTVRQLLEHRSGAPANANWWQLHLDNPDDVVAARRALLRWLVTRSRPRKTQYLYSNVGYAILGHVLEQIEQQPWEVVLRRRLSEPLEMTSVGFGPVGADGDSDVDIASSQFAWGHVEEKSLVGMVGDLFGVERSIHYKPVQLDNPPPLGPAGRVHLNLVDWAKFALLFADQGVNDRVAVSDNEWKEMLRSSSEENAYAGGWRLLERDWAGGRVLHHGGSNTTWHCVAWIAPEKHFCVLAATNAFGDQAIEACDKAVAAALKVEPEMEQH